VIKATIPVALAWEGNSVHIVQEAWWGPVVGQDWYGKSCPYLIRTPDTVARSELL